MFRKRPEKDLTPDEILVKIEHYCAYQERSPMEVQRKLALLGAKSDLADQMYAVLESDGFIDATRFATAFAGGKFRVNHWGRVRIRLRLRQHGISELIIAQALAEIDEKAYLQTLQTLLGHKKQQLADDPNAKQKTAAYLIRAGFEPELVFANL
ncbi:MAG: RecX family transcriptional regulator [Lewinellaceae bacterium]|nr:RecX family transcriptional regulator [Lewinellaceae bacterium]